MTTRKATTTSSPRGTLFLNLLNRKYKLLDNSSKFSMSHRLQIFNTIFKPSWAYSTELWSFFDLPFYVSNKIIHRHINVPLVQDLVISRYKFPQKITDNPNPLVYSLFPQNISSDTARWLKLAKRSAPHLPMTFYLAKII